MMRLISFSCSRIVVAVILSPPLFICDNIYVVSVEILPYIYERSQTDDYF